MDAVNHSPEDASLGISSTNSSDDDDDDYQE